MNKRLTYEEYKGCKDIITIDLHNGFTVIAIKMWNKDRHNYSVQLMLKENTIDKWDLIEKAECLEFNVNYKTINSAILKQVAKYLKEDFFNYYIERFNYEIKCFEIGNKIIEKESLGAN